MKFLATIKKGFDRSTMLFDSYEKAEGWLEENNIGGKYLSYIEEFDDDWNKVGDYIITQEQSDEN